MLRPFKTTLKAEINEEAATLNNGMSSPFDKPKSGCVEAQVIKRLGDEVMKRLGVSCVLHNLRIKDMTWH